MESLKEFLTPERFNLYGYIVAVIFLFFGVLIFGITTGLRASERRNFHCNVGSNSAFDKNYLPYLRAKCFDQYDQQYNSPLPLSAFPVLSFSILTIVCIVYSWCCVKCRVEEVEQACKFDAENSRPRPRITTRRVFNCYLTQLVLRVILGIVFTVLQECILYPSGFPTGFPCQLNLEKSKGLDVNSSFTNSNSSFIDCQNSIGSDKAVWSMIIWIVNIIFVFLVAGEVIYLLYKVWRNKDFMIDSEFCQIHLFNKRKTPSRTNQLRIYQQRRIIEDTEVIEPLIPPKPGENQGCKNLDDIYVDLIIHTGRSRQDFDMTTMDKLEILYEYYKSPQDSIKINKLEELLLPNKDSDNPRKILIVGCPGIGKSLLCTKLIHDWSKGKILHQTNKFHYTFLICFRSLNSDEMKNMSLQTLLGQAKHADGKIDDDYFQSILENPDKVLLVFDGLDELKDHEKCMEDEEKHAGNGVAEVMPTSALYVKVVKGKMLGGATVLTTTRPYAMDSVGGLHFDRAVEIMGFTPEKVEEYCRKFFQSDTDVMNRIWQHIESNLNLLYLCYIPVNCFIVCSLLEKIVSLFGCHSGGVILPTTLTEIYKGVLKLFIFKHHPEYQGQTLKKRDLSYDGAFSDSVEETLLKLESLAVKCIGEKRLVFESEEVQGMENCGLLNRMDDVETAPFSYKSQYCFIHLTMQEFVAARKIVKMDPQELKEFISSKAKDAKWDLVIQFVAGILRGKETVAKDSFVELLHHGLLSYNKKLALLMMKSLYELDDTSTVKKAAAELMSNSKFTNNIYLSDLSIMPVDCTAIVYFLKHIDTLQYLDVSENPLGKGGCSELAKLLKEGGPQQLDLSDCMFPYQGLISLLEAIKTEKCILSQLSLFGPGNVTDEGLSCLFDTVNDENFKLNALKLFAINVSFHTVLNICVAIKHKNSKLTKLALGLSVLTDQCLSYLSEALKNKNCKLTELNVGSHEKVEEVTNQGLSDLCEGLKHENCKLTKLTLQEFIVTDQVLSYLGKVLENKNCNLTELNVGSLEKVEEVTNKGLSDLCEAVKHENCKLTKLTLQQIIVTDRVLSCFGKVLKNKNCKLTELNVFRGLEKGNDVPMADKGISDLCEALKHENCKLTKLTLQQIIVTDGVLSYLGKALKNKNCKLTELNVFGCLDEGKEVFMADKGISDLCEALEHENCKLTKLTLEGIIVTDQGLSCFGKALKNKNCKLTELNVLGCLEKGKEVPMADKGISDLCEALEHENCKLTKLTFENLFITDRVLPYFCEALKNKNCNLTELKLSSPYSIPLPEILEKRADKGLCITDRGISDLGDALTHKNCKLTELILGGPGQTAITNEGISNLENAITQKHCKTKYVRIFREFNSNLVIGICPYPKYCKVTRSSGDGIFNIKGVSAERSFGHSILNMKGVSGQYDKISLDNFKYGKLSRFTSKYTEISMHFINDTKCVYIYLER